MREKIRIYNWDGEKYRFLGRERLRRLNDTYVVNMRERMGDMSFTTRYLLFASSKFVKKHRYESLLFCAGRNEAWLPVEERMQAEVLFSYHRSARGKSGALTARRKAGVDAVFRVRSGRVFKWEKERMVTISLCMIVKNEERILARCLDSLQGLADEIIIVDTGSVDETKRIAAKYTEQIYDFAWTGDFSEARNFAFSKAKMEYIYSADADEVLDEENRAAFLRMKEVLLPEIEIVQMYYVNQLANGTIYNYDKELRPKLFKRNRTFRWQGAIHEQIGITPVIYDSEICIQHMPEENHKDRDLAAFARLTAAGETLDKRLHNIYAKELFISGEAADFLAARAFFRNPAETKKRGEEELMEAACVAARAARLAGDVADFFKYAMKAVASEGCAEICCELGAFYMERKDYDEAVVWLYNAAYETESILDIHSGGDLPLRGLAKCYQELGNETQAAAYAELAAKWTV